MNQVLNEDTAIRATAMITDGGTSRDNVNNYREGFAPTIRFGIGTQNESSLSYYYLKVHNTADFGLPFLNGRPLDVSTNKFYGTTMDFEENTTNMLTHSYVRRFSGDSEVKNTFRVARYERAPPMGNSTTDY